MSLLGNWKEILNSANLSPDKPMDLISRWLIINLLFPLTLSLFG